MTLPRLRLRVPASIAARVQLLVVACIVPAWLLAVVVLYQAHHRDREALVHSTVQLARATAASIDRELAAQVAVLQTLSQSPLIDDADYTRLHASGQRVMQLQGADNIVLFDPQLRRLLSLRHPPGPAGPPLGHDLFPEVMRTGQSAVSDLFVGRVSQRPQVAVAVPVLRGERVLGRLEMILSPERLSQALGVQKVREGWTVTVIDRQGVLVARNRDASRFVGKPATEGLRKAMKVAHEGFVRNRTLDGIDGITCYSRAPHSGWTAVVAIPMAALEVQWRQALWQQGAGALVLLGLGLVLAQWLGRRLARPINALVAPALAVGRGEDVAIAPTGLREADTLAGALAQASQRLREREQALKDSEARLHMALEVAHIGHWTLDMRTGHIEHSLQHDRCFGHDQPMAPWDLEVFFASVHPDDRVWVRETIDQLPLAHGSVFFQEFRVLWPDGSEHWLRSQGLYVAMGGPKVTHIKGLVMDITDRKQADELRLHGARLEAENRQIQETNRLKSEFLANMSHELRTPLNAVIGFADVLSEMGAGLSDDKRQQYLQHIGDSGRHLLRLINDVLDLSKVEAGRFEIHPEPLQLTPLVREVCGVLQTACASKHVTLVTELHPSVEELVLDPARLRQMLYNFLSNAIKFTPAGGQVSVRAQPEGEGEAWVRIEVEDTGIGISSDDLPKLFHQFQQLHSGLKKPFAGTGLGLVLTQRLAELHGGHVGVRSTLGQGSVFYVVLPRHAVVALDDRP